jgi:hypothetical protein
MGGTVHTKDPRDASVLCSGQWSPLLLLLLLAIERPPLIQVAQPAHSAILARVQAGLQCLPVLAAAVGLPHTTHTPLLRRWQLGHRPA